MEVKLLQLDGLIRIVVWCLKVRSQCVIILAKFVSIKIFKNFNLSNVFQLSDVEKVHQRKTTNQESTSFNSCTVDNGMFYILNIILLEFIFLTLLVHPIAGHPVIEDLKKQLREKDMVLTDIRLEADTDENT